jgi:hypothetical protein
VSVKFKIGFTVDSEVLLGLFAKLLPIEDVTVKELTPIPTGRVITGIRAHPQIARKTNRRSPGPNLEKGVNGVILAELSTGPKRAVELKPKVAAAGFSVNSVNSRLESLHGFGVIERIGKGRWRVK